ncbi:MAG: U32 family peptidase [Clostridiales bacterium]|nr:U32 family peptidase [Clostridiales bacterium]
MKLLTPVVSKRDVIEFSAITEKIEYYLGFDLSEWKERFGPGEELNRMSAFRKSANITGLEEIPEILEAAFEHKVYVTINSGCYSPEQEYFIDGLLERLATLGVDGIIVGDMFLAKRVKKYGLKPVASTMAGIYNSDIAKFFIEEGFKRLILPRDLTLSEISEIISAAPEAEYECFLMRNGCRYSDANCLGRHGEKYGAVCSYLDRSKTTYGGVGNRNFYLHEEVVFNHQVYRQAFHKSACGMCAIWDLLQMGVTAGKVVGRADGWKSMENDIRVLAENIDIAENCATREEYLEKMCMPYQYDDICLKGWNCYYPEARYPKER